MERSSASLIAKAIFPLLMLVAVLTATSAPANPSITQPDAPLDVLSHPACVSLQQAAFELWQRNSSRCAKIQALRQIGHLDEVDPAEIGKVYVDGRQLQRWGEQLACLGQVAGFDFVFRAQQQQALSERWGDEYQRLDKFSLEIRPQVQRDMDAALRSGLAQLTELNQLVAAEDWQPAEALLARIHAGLDQNRVFFQSKALHPFYSPFANQYSSVTPAIARQRQKAALELWTEAATAAQPNYEAETQRILAALDDVRTGRSRWNDKSLSEPELIAALAQQWLEVQHQTLQTLGYWQTAYATNADKPYVLARIEELRKAHESYGQEMQAAIVGIIDADSTLLAPEEIPGRYGDYLMVLAPLADWTESENTPGAPRWEAALAPVFAKFTRRSPELLAKINTYRAATMRVLRWRERVAAARETGMRKQHSELAFRLAEVTAPTAQFRGLHSGRFGGVFQLQSPASESLVALRGMIDEPYAVGPAHRLPWDQPVLLSTFRNSLYAAAELPDSPAYDAAAKQLQTDLLLDRGFVPLTLEAARTQYALQQREPLMLVGSVRDVYLEPWSVRFAELPPSGRAMARLGFFPDMTGSANEYSLCVRVIVRPRWVRHRHFFVELTP